jgi:transaldolase/glucose-6-phosphate isomerase
MTKLHELNEAGQSVWLDYIRRAFIESGEMQALIDQGVTGVTSNPSIFEKAIAGSADYDAAMHPLVEAGKSAMEIYEALALVDIQQAADLFRPIYDQTNATDGYVSMEVNPELAHDTAGTIAEARRLFAALDRPNVLIKVPATPAGIPAIRSLISEGININVTLMFSLDHYNAVAEAYISGLEDRLAAGEAISRVASVASFFLSRVDTAVDAALDKKGHEALKGKIAVANSKVTYARFQELFSSERWQRLAAHGAQVQKVLWASTSTKNPAYADVMYVEPIIGPHTVNTMPQSTLNAFQDHGTAARTVTADLAQAQEQLATLADLGIDLDQITENLQDEGVQKFADAFQGLLQGVTDKKEQLEAGWSQSAVDLGDYQEAVDAALATICAEDIMGRIWTHDHTVWREDSQEISNRLGWLHAPEQMATNVARIQQFVREVRADGLTRVLLLGMGGSSLAPEVFFNVFGQPAGPDNDYLELAVLDSTDPQAVRALAERFPPQETLYIVATKSGGTVETLSFFKYFYNRAVAALGQEAAGRHFVAITDPGSKLVTLAEKHHFRTTFLNDPHVGGRYSALTYFGLVPAALVGVGLGRLLSNAELAAQNSKGCNDPIAGDNASAQVGVMIAELAQAGRDKLTFITSPALANFGDWVEQLIAESTGKDGKGILPVVGIGPAEPEAYGADRFFVYLRLAGDDTHDAAYAKLMKAGHPGVTIHLPDLYALGGQMMMWEMATAVAGNRLGIQPFNQPNVESAKVRAREMVAAYHETGQLPQVSPTPLTAGAYREFLGQARPGDYIAVQAFIPPTPETSALLHDLQAQLRSQTGRAVTVGYGPRFLHSTGQLHKGDGGNGLFIQLTSDPVVDLPIPDEAGSDQSGITFGVLKMAQALGDAQALRDAGRRLIHFHLGEDVKQGLTTLIAPGQ